MLKKNAITVILAIILISTSTTQANESENDVGFITIKDIKTEQQQEDPKENPAQLGFFNVPGEILPEKVKEAIPTEESGKAEGLLAEISAAQRKHDYVTAYQGMLDLRHKYPEIPLFWKWSAIYADMARDTETSLSLWDEYFATFPFEPSGIEELYYKADALIQLKRNDEADAIIIKAMDIIKTSPTKIRAFSVKADANVLENAFSFLALKNNPSAIDANQIDKLWKRISKPYRNSLQNYYGFDLSEVWFWYGKEFGNAEALQKYINAEKENPDAKTVSKVQEAKKILFRE